MSKFSIFKHGWEGDNTICGWGSTLKNTENIRKDFKIILDIIREETGKKEVTLNDAGCGDLWWIREVLNYISDINYTGYDIYPRFSWLDLNVNCKKLNICEEVMRPCDLILCRDVFIHFPNEFILNALQLFKKSGKFLYTTTYSGEDLEFSNYSRITEFSLKHSKLNLCSSPFNLGPPIFITEENYATKCCKKFICLWRL